MMADDVEKFAAKVEARTMATFVNTAVLVQESVVDGSPVTGAPGQPVDTGALRASWQLTFPGATVAEVATAVEYAPAIEAGIGPHGPMTLRSAVGGFHSVALTRSSFDRVVEHALKQAGG